MDAELGEGQGRATCINCLFNYHRCAMIVGGEEAKTKVWGCRYGINSSDTQ
jgi:hypothetical protein